MRKTSSIQRLAEIINERADTPPKMTGSSVAVETDLTTRQNRLPLPIGSVGQVLTVIDDSGDIVPSWEDATGGTPISELDDIPDVNAPTPANGDVLTWDATPGEWVAAAPTGGTPITELDDVPDVNAPAPSNGDVLTWDSTPGEWVALPAAAGYTDEQVRDVIGTALVAGNNIDITVNDPGDTITIDVESLTSADITDFTEAAQDAVAAMTIDTSSINFTYTDATPELKAEIVDAYVQALIDASVAGGAGQVFGLEWVIDEGGVPGLNTKAYRSVPFACTITGWTLLADQSGDIVLDVWKDTYSAYPPVVGDTICGGNKPTLSAAVKATDSTLTSWTNLSFAANDVVTIHVDSASSLQVVTFMLICERT